MQRWLEVADRFVFPRSCAGCGAADPGGRLSDAWPFCPVCTGAIEPIDGPACLRCGIPFSVALRGGAEICTECRADPPKFERLISAARYGGPLAKALTDHKYRGAVHLAAPFATALGLAAAGQGLAPRDFDAVVPVPMPLPSLLARGRNHAAAIAAKLARWWKLPLRDGLIVRARATAPQASLSGTARRNNLRGAFGVDVKRWRAAGDLEHVLVIDDIVTTGATAREMARAITVETGARVTVLSVARTCLHEIWSASKLRHFTFDHARAAA